MEYTIESGDCATTNGFQCVEASLEIKIYTKIKIFVRCEVVQLEILCM